MADFNWDDPFSDYGNDGSFLSTGIFGGGDDTPTDFGSILKGTDPTSVNWTPSEEWTDAFGAGKFDTNTDGWKKIGSNIVDAAGNLVKKLANGETLKDIIGLYQGNKMVNSTSDFTSEMKNAAVNNLLKLQQSIAGMNQPELAQYVQNIAKAVNLGTIQPAQAMASIQEKSASQGIQIPAEYTAAINDTLGGLDEVSKNGYTAIEKAAIQKALNQIMTQARGEQEAIKTNMMERGQWGVGQELVNRNMVAQGAANTASQQGLDIQAAGLKRALEALQAKGQLGMNASQQSFNQQKSQADAQDLINRTNAELRQQMAAQNAEREQQAILQNQANAYKVQDTNIAQSNLQQQRLLDAKNAEYENALKNATLQSNVAGNAGKDAAVVLGKAYESQLGAKDYQNKQVQASSNSKSSTLGKIATVAGGLLGGLFSDEEVKENKKELSDDEFDAILAKVVPTSFTYKRSVQEVGAPGGPVVGVMAQDLEKSPAGAAMVGQTPAGKVIDKDKALSLALAGLASMSKRIRTLEGK